MWTLVWDLSADATLKDFSHDEQRNDAGRDGQSQPWWRDEVATTRLHGGPASSNQVKQVRTPWIGA